MATTKRAKPYIWVTWISGLLSGSQQCVWASWFKTHFKYDKRPDNFDLAAWSADHDRLVRAHQTALECEGRSVTSEKSNNFHLHGETAILAGQPDLISRKDGQSLRVSDGKTGEQSKKDWWQVVVYLVAIPLAWKQPSLRMHGELVYKSGHRVTIEPEEVTPERRQEIFALIRMLASDVVPKRTPSQSDCGRCDIAVCEDRFVEKAPELMTSEF